MLKKEFFNTMLSKIEYSNDIEVLTDPETRALKGGGVCNCKKGTLTCTPTFTSTPTSTTTVNPTVNL